MDDDDDDDDVRGYWNGWKSGVNTALGGYSKHPKHLWWVKKKMGPDSLVHQDLPHMGILRGELTKLQVIYLKKIQL